VLAAGAAWLWFRYFHFTPGAVTIMAQGQGILYDGGEDHMDGHASDRLVALAGVFGERVHRQRVAAKVEAHSYFRIATKLPKADLGIVDTALIQDELHIVNIQGPFDVKPIAILAIDPYVLAIAARLRYEALDDAMVAASRIGRGDDNTVQSELPLAVAAPYARRQIFLVPLAKVIKRVGGQVNHLLTYWRFADSPSAVLIREAVENERPMLLVATLSQVHEFLGDGPHQLRPLLICDTQPLTLAGSRIPTAQESGFECPPMQFVAAVVHKDAPTRYERYWRRTLADLATDERWLGSLRGAGLLPKALFGEQAGQFVDRQQQQLVAIKQYNYESKGRLDLAEDRPSESRDIHR
jgi:hypothetical protein